METLDLDVLTEADLEDSLAYLYSQLAANKHDQLSDSWDDSLSNRNAQLAAVHDSSREASLEELDSRQLSKLAGGDDDAQGRLALPAQTFGGVTKRAKWQVRC